MLKSGVIGMTTLNITIDAGLSKINPDLALGILHCRAMNSKYNSDLWKEIQQVSNQLRETLSFEGIKQQPQIAATRKTYAACGKDPSRYRPSAEALMRRIIKNQDLYQISTLIDLINLVSLKWGYSIGGFDASLIEDPLKAGIGRDDEVFHAIGRGILNIENLPVLRDSKGAIGSPTSDEERTSIRDETNQLLMVIYAFDGPENLEACMDYAQALLIKHAAATVMSRDIIKAS